MNDELKLSEFDTLGIIVLDDIQGIEKYVTPIIKKGVVEGYLSRSKEYYNVKTMRELAMEREELRSKLTEQPNKRNFVILENMLNCSGKVYFKKFEKYIREGKKQGKTLKELKQAAVCMEEDMNNIIAIFENKEKLNFNTMTILPFGEENSEKRAIEMDNKALLYVFAKCLKMNKKSHDIEVLNPGYGSIYIGPILKCMFGYNYTNFFKSKYIEESMPLDKIDIEKLLSSNRIFEKTKTILVLDDNIGTGQTLNEIKECLKRKDKIDSVIVGALQYNWRNYYRVSVGEKNVQRFEISDFDILSPINFAGHKLYKHAIDLLHSSGSEYINYLKTKNYRREDMCDLEGDLFRGILCSRAANLELQDGFYAPVDETYKPKKILEQYRVGPKTVSNLISREIIRRIIQEIGYIKYKNSEEIYKS